MTRRARWTRPFAVLFALWFAVIIGDPGLVHSCPMHGGHGMAQAGAAAIAMQDMMAMQGDQVASASDHASQGSQDHGTTSHCTCVGQCRTVGTVAPLPTVASLHVPATVALAEPPLRLAFQPVAAAPDTRLPFANGPPTA